MLALIPAPRGVCKTRNTPGTSHDTPEHPETASNTPRTPKIVVSGQTAHELTNPEDLPRFPTLHKTFADHPEISEHFKNASE